MVQDHTECKFIEEEGATTAIAAYAGFDPTGGRLHVGHLPLLMTLCTLHQNGVRPIALVGGATASIGDPSGRSTERPMIDTSEIENNATGIQRDIQEVWDGYEGWADRTGAKAPSTSGTLELVNNQDWYRGMHLLQFMHSTARYMGVTGMLERESVRNRLESDSGISLLEFMYQAFQAYDFWHLYCSRHCRLQVGGADQWGNIVAGSQLVRRKLAALRGTPAANTTPCAPAEGLTIPLLTTADGQKIGKSAGNAVIWLSRRHTSDYDLYQYFYRTTDDLLEPFFLRFTLVPPEEIQRVCNEHSSMPERRRGQRALAREVLSFLRGTDSITNAETVSDILYGNREELLSSQLSNIAANIGEMPHFHLPREEEKPPTVLDLLVLTGLSKSRNEARRSVKGGGVYWNKVRVDDATSTPTEWVHGEIGVLQVGARKLCLVLKGNSIRNPDSDSPPP